MSNRLTIYGNWSAYDELSDGIELTEELAMRQFDEMLRLRANGVQIDGYLMDAFWFSPEGGYRTWRVPNWPNGPDRWLDACRTHGIIPGLWFTANTLCHLILPATWADSADENQWGLCCFHGGFMDDFVEVLDLWYSRGIRIFKLDFADFGAAPPHLKSQLSPEEIRDRNQQTFRSALLRFRSTHPEAVFMAFNGFERLEYMDRTDRPLEQVIDLHWLDVFDSIYSGDPRPADIPAFPFWRAVDIYGDHTTRVLEHSGVPLRRIDNCGFMAGPTGTCYWRGAAMWKGMFLLTYLRGGDLTVLYGDLALITEEDAKWMAQAQALLEPVLSTSETTSFGGLPGLGEPYGWNCGDELIVVVNPSPTTTGVQIPDGPWHIAFSDSGFQPMVRSGFVELGPFQMALLTLKDVDLGRQDDCQIQPLENVPFEVLSTSDRSLTAQFSAGRRVVFVTQLDASNRLVKSYSSPSLASDWLTISATQGSAVCQVAPDCDRIIWSGMTWGSAVVTGFGEDPIRVEITSKDPNVASLELQVWKFQLT